MGFLKKQLSTDKGEAAGKRRGRSMKFVRYQKAEGAYWGMVEGDVISALAGAPWDTREPTGEQTLIGEVNLLPPAEPGNIFCVGLNYADHAEEYGLEMPEEPNIFLKGINSLLGHEGTILIPGWSGRIDYEGEMAVVIGKRCRNVPEAEARNVVFGLTCLNDVTARALSKKDARLTRSKSFDTFCPMGPWLVDSRETGGRDIQTRLNGKVVQSSNTDKMGFSVPRIIALISRFATLSPGDVIATGTPAGIGPLRAGDVVEVEIEGVGTLKNHCAGEAP